MHRSRNLTRKAKQEGYAARSVYKLLAINARYHLIRKGDAVLDLGCWPGSWLQACVQMGVRVVGIDLKHTAIRGAETLKGDVYDKNLLLQLSSYGSFDVVLSDLAPSTTGHREQDQQESLGLSKQAFVIAKRFLKPGGNFLVKVFQSSEANTFLKELGRDFQFVKAYKPEASRKRSKEMYYVCLGLRG